MPQSDLTPALPFPSRHLAFDFSPLQMAVLVLRHALAVLCLALCALHGASGKEYDGQFFSGTGDSEWFGLLDKARRMVDMGATGGDPQYMTVGMLYDPLYNALREGPTWDAWWTTNSYGPTYCGLPFATEPFTTWLQTAQDYWFDHMGNGTLVDPAGNVGPDGALCDDGGPTYCRYKQGDGNQTVDDFAVEESLSAVVMQAELLLISRDPITIARYRPLFLRTSDWLETRRDPSTNLFLTGAACTSRSTVCLPRCRRHSCGLY
jgi:hypothetical protein